MESHMHTYPRMRHSLPFWRDRQVPQPIWCRRRWPGKPGVPGRGMSTFRELLEIKVYSISKQKCNGHSTWLMVCLFQTFTSFTVSWWAIWFHHVYCAVARVNKNIEVADLHQAKRIEMTLSDGTSVSKRIWKGNSLKTFQGLVNQWWTKYIFTAGFGGLSYPPKKLELQLVSCALCLTFLFVWKLLGAFKHRSR